ncbi:MAG: hypothetical protein CM15mV5_0540 [uncultured marine virus]|nr:MAG: hypothetical protein CM15mV5_0540 [uncultured marine virus]
MMYIMSMMLKRSHHMHLMELMKHQCLLLNYRQSICGCRYFSVTSNTFKFSQDTDTLIPQIDIDNPVSDPIIARSSADPVLIGSVKTSTGLNAATTDPADPSFSITKEAISCYFYEYFNNELEWSWTGKNSPTSQLSHTINLNNLDGTHGATTVNLNLEMVVVR